MPYVEYGSFSKLEHEVDGIWVSKKSRVQDTVSAHVSLNNK